MNLNDEIGEAGREALLACYMEAAADLTARQVLGAHVLGTLMAQLEEPSDELWAYAQALGLDADDVTSWFDEYSSALSAAIHQVEDT
jgi:hypothetical protein